MQDYKDRVAEVKCEHKQTYRTEYGEKCKDCPVYIWRIPSVE